MWVSQVELSVGSSEALSNWFRSLQSRQPDQPGAMHAMNVQLQNHSCNNMQLCLPQTVNMRAFFAQQDHVQVFIYSRLSLFSEYMTRDSGKCDQTCCCWNGCRSCAESSVLLICSNRNSAGDGGWPAKQLAATGTLFHVGHMRT